MSDEPRLDPNGPDLNLRQAAKALGRSPRSVRRLLREGTFPPGLRRTKPHSGPWIFPQSVLIAYLDSTVQNQSQPQPGASE